MKPETRWRSRPSPWRPWGTLAGAAAQAGVSVQTLMNRVAQGMTPADAVAMGRQRARALERRCPHCGGEVYAPSTRKDGVAA